MGRLKLVAVKAVHSIIFFLVETCMMLVIVDGLRGRRDSKTALAAGVVAAETAVFLGNGAHCPLTSVAERLGGGSGSVTDIYLPRIVAKNLPGIHVPLILWALWLHRSVLPGRRPPAP
jgi:hypothetical protein